MSLGHAYTQARCMNRPRHLPFRPAIATAAAVPVHGTSIVINHCQSFANGVGEMTLRDRMDRPPTEAMYECNCVIQEKDEWTFPWPTLVLFDKNCTCVTFGHVNDVTWLASHEDKLGPPVSDSSICVTTSKKLACVFLRNVELFAVIFHHGSRYPA